MNTQFTDDVALSHLGAVARSMGEGLLTLDGAGCFTYVNPAAESLLGWALEDLRGLDMHTTIHHSRPDGSHYPADQCPLIGARRDGLVVRVEDDMFIRRDGSRLPVAYTSAPLNDHGPGGSVVVFRDATAQREQEALVSEQLEALATLQAIRESLAENRFVLHAQPIVNLESDATTQHELLIRMIDRDGRTIMPHAFLPVAEEHGSIREIDRWVIREAVGFVSRGHAVQINLSAHSFGDVETFGFIERELIEAGADPHLLGIEITETAVLADPIVATQVISALQKLGCPVALDDFGTGHAGFGRLKTLPLSYIKIDIEFVRDLVTDEGSRHVVRAVVDLARSFGYGTIAEGVEDQATLDLLRDLGVNYAQGYFLGRPAPAADVFAGPRRVLDGCVPEPPPAALDASWAAGSQPAGIDDPPDRSQLLWLQRLQRALTNDRFLLFAQPVVELAAGTVVRHKLLIGMLGDDGELFAPEEFMPTAERFGLMSAIDRWVLHQACSYAANGHAVQLELCAGTLVDRDIDACVQDELLVCGAPPALVGFAVSASALSAHGTLGPGFVDLMQSLGCSVAVGDFTVFTQLGDRGRVQIDCLNISPQVISSLLTDPAGERVVAEIVRWAEAAELGTVAEGVEDQATLERVHALGVRYAQGDHLGLLVPAREALHPGAPLPAVRR